MPRNVGTVINNSFTRGLITEATGLNFPENAVTDSRNVVFEAKGSVRRRKGIDIEGSAITQAYSNSTGIVKEFIWDAVARTGGFTFLVLQLGQEVHFFQLAENESLSAQVLPTSLSLADYKAPSGGDIASVPCSFSAGSGYLFVAHPHCEPIIVRWNQDDEQFEASEIHPLIRDFEGEEDGLGVAENPSTLTSKHHYNLRNQGWNQKVRIGSVSNEAGTGGSLGGSAPPLALDWNAL